jgi:hypothetical protein
MLDSSVANCAGAAGNGRLHHRRHLLLELLGDQYAHLTQTLIAPPVNFTLPEPQNLLDDEKTGLKDIAELLSKPALSGVYLTHQQIKALALSLELPKGFGSRQQTLVNLLRTAVQYEPAGLMPMRKFSPRPPSSSHLYAPGWIPPRTAFVSPGRSVIKPQCDCRINTDALRARF